MKKKSLFVGVLTLAVGACTALGLAACNNDKPNETEAKITEGIYDGTYTAQGYTQDNYIRFFEDGEVLGKQCFYYHVFTKDSTIEMPVVDPLLGTYEVVDESYTMKSYADSSHRDKDAGDPFVDRTADKTVICYSLDGNTEYFRTGWDTKENKLLGIPAANTGLGITADNKMGVSSFYGNYCLLNSTADKTDKGVALNTFYCDTETVKNASIVIYHNGTYADNKVTGTDTVNGTYTVSESTYTLTAGTGATGGSLVIGTNGATFTPTGGTAINMSSTRNRQPLDGYVFTGRGIPEGMETERDITVTLYDDNSVSVTGLQKTMEGFWEEGDEGIITITDLGVDIFVETKTDADGEYYEVTVSGVTCRTESVEKVTLLHTYTNNKFMGLNATATIKLYSDGSAVLECDHAAVGPQLGSPCEGTYEGRNVTITTNAGSVEFTISGEEGNYVASNAQLGDFTGTTAPEATNPNPGPETPKPVTALFTLTGKVTGPDQTGQGTTEYDAELKLNDDLSFVLNLTNNGVTVPAAKGTFAANTQTGGYTLTVKESTFYTVDSTLTVSAEWDLSNPQNPVAKSLSVELPEAKTTYPGVGEITVLNEATLSYSSVTEVAKLTGTSTDAMSNTHNLEMIMYSDYTFVLNDTGIKLANGTFSVNQSTGTYTVTITDSGNYTIESITVTMQLDGYTPTGMTAKVSDIKMDYNGNPVTAVPEATLTYTFPAQS